ncbi:hypothetical protein HTG_07860 [Natrinema mahii]|nr:hypothetical protein HTG_07860 [Natrinema mahii]
MCVSMFVSRANDVSERVEEPPAGVTTTFGGAFASEASEARRLRRAKRTGETRECASETQQKVPA